MKTRETRVPEEKQERWQHLMVNLPSEPPDSKSETLPQVKHYLNVAEAWTERQGTELHQEKLPSDVLTAIYHYQ